MQNLALHTCASFLNRCRINVCKDLGNGSFFIQILQLNAVWYPYLGLTCVLFTVTLILALVLMCTSNAYKYICRVFCAISTYFYHLKLCFTMSLKVPTLYLLSKPLMWFLLMKVQFMSRMLVMLTSFCTMQYMFCAEAGLLKHSSSHSILRAEDSS